MNEKRLKINEEKLKLCYTVKKSSFETCKQCELSEFSSLETLVRDKFGDEGFCVFYLDNEVLFGKYYGSNFLFFERDHPKLKYIQKMRLFNQEKELLLWRKRWKGQSGDFAFRLRVDEEGEDVDVVEAMQILWGTAAGQTPDKNFTELSEKRGMKLNIPLKDFVVNDGEETRLFVLTRNYITYETDDPSYMQASYFDSRFVSFTDKDGELLGW